MTMHRPCTGVGSIIREDEVAGSGKDIYIASRGIGTGCDGAIPWSITLGEKVHVVSMVMDWMAYSDGVFHMEQYNLCCVVCRIGGKDVVFRRKVVRFASIGNAFGEEERWGIVV